MLLLCFEICFTLIEYGLKSVSIFKFDILKYFETDILWVNIKTGMFLYIVFMGL